MNKVQHKRSSRSGATSELVQLRTRLAEVEATLRAIRRGEVDAVVVEGRRGPRVFTLEGAEHVYRVLVEFMNEGALTLTTDKMILYANERFAAMVKCPLEQVLGSSFRRFLSVEDRATHRGFSKQIAKSGSVQLLLNAGDGSRVPAQISFRRLPSKGSNRATVGMVVTDMTQSRRSEEMLRALSQRLVHAQETERGRVALELHDHITQPLCAILIRFQALVGKLSARDRPSKQEAMELRDMLGRTAEEVERISRNLRPSVLEQLGLVAALRSTSMEFADRTSVSLTLACVELIRLPADAELALYRILQEALSNVERHASARHVTVRLKRQNSFVQLAIHDDGIGFDPEQHGTRRRGKRGLGLLSMRERANYVGGTLEVKSARRGGTEIKVRIPLLSAAAKAAKKVGPSSNPWPSSHAATRS